MGYPTVTKETVKQFGRAWDHRGLKMILDDTSVQFAMDFANVAMRSYVDSVAEKVLAAAKKKYIETQAAVQAEPVQTGEGTAHPKPSIVLTDL